MKLHRKMKNSGVKWIGEIPEDWDIVRVSAIADKTSYSIVDGPFGSDLKNEEYVDDGVKIVQLNNIKPFNHSLNKIICVTNEKAKQLSRHIAKSGDIVVAKMMPAGRACILSGDNEEYVVCADVIKIAISDEIKKKFLLYALNSYGMIASEYMAGGTTRTRINVSVLRKMGVALPQTGKTIESIVNYLDEKCAKLDAVIEKQRASIEELQAYKLAVITEAVTKGLNPSVEMKDSGVEWIGEMPKHWTISMLKNGIDILPGYAFSSDDFDVSHGIPLLRGINVTPSGIRWEEVVYYNQELSDELKMYELSEGDIVMGMDRPWISDGTRVCWVTKNDLPMLLVQRVCRIRARGNLDKRWIYYWLDSKAFQESLSVETTGVSVPHISTKQIGNFAVTLPPISEQKNICDDIDRKCSQIDSIIKGKENIVDNLIAYKKSLIYEVVTGKKEV